MEVSIIIMMSLFGLSAKRRGEPQDNNYGGLLNYSIMEDPIIILIDLPGLSEKKYGSPFIRIIEARIIIMIRLPGFSGKRHEKSIIPIMEGSIILMMDPLGLSAKRRGESIHSNYRDLHNYYDGSPRTFWEKTRGTPFIAIMEVSIISMMGLPGFSEKRRGKPHHNNYAALYN